MNGLRRRTDARPLLTKVRWRQRPGAKCGTERERRLVSMAEVWISEGAEEDYVGSLRWYAERSQKAAEAFQDEFAGALQAIVDDPDRYPACDSRHRFFLMKRYPF